MKEIISRTLVASLFSLTFSSVLTENTGNDLTSLLHSNLETVGGWVWGSRDRCRAPVSPSGKWSGTR